MTVLLTGIVVALALADWPALAAMVCVLAVASGAKDLRRLPRGGGL